MKALFIRSATALAVATAFALPVSLLAATPKDTLVVTWAIDDIITMDPGEAFEISAGEIMGNSYDRLLRYDAANIAPGLRPSGGLPGRRSAAAPRA